MAVKNRAASVLARLKMQSKNTGISYQMILQLFLQEEFLRRLCISKYRDNFVLKGGMFIYTMTNFESRPTQDIDFMLRRLSSDLDNVKAIMTEICEKNTGNEFIHIKVVGTEQITPEKKYPGVKTKFIGSIENVRIPFSIDVGIDDVIIPDPRLRIIPTRLPDFEPAEVMTYSIESTIAEKFDAIIMRMETNSRMKDFYDIYYLSGMFNFDGLLLQKAVHNTISHRNRLVPENLFERIDAFSGNSYLVQMWKNFKPAAEAGLTFDEALHGVILFIQPIIDSISNGLEFQEKWNSEIRQWVNGIQGQ